MIRNPGVDARESRKGLEEARDSKRFDILCKHKFPCDLLTSNYTTTIQIPPRSQRGRLSFLVLTRDEGALNIDHRTHTTYPGLFKATLMNRLHDEHWTPKIGLHLNKRRWQRAKYIWHTVKPKPDEEQFPEHVMTLHYEMLANVIMHRLPDVVALFGNTTQTGQYRLKQASNFPPSGKREDPLYYSRFAALDFYWAIQEMEKYREVNHIWWPCGFYDGPKGVLQRISHRHVQHTFEVSAKYDYDYSKPAPTFKWYKENMSTLFNRIVKR